MELTKTFEYARVENNTIEIDGNSYGVVRGKHAFWIPKMEAKIVWSYNGKIESFTHWEKGRNKEALLSHTFNDGCKGFDIASLLSIASEYHLMKELAKHSMAPEVGDLFYIKNMIAKYIYGAPHCDPKGCYGYFIKDATKLPPGKFSMEKFKKEFIDTGLIRASQGALGDLEKESNIINGYLIDVRRTLWDMIAWEGQHLNTWSIKYIEDKNDLKKAIYELGQFPYKQRKMNYQSYYLDGEYIEGSRDTLYRFDKMQIPENLSKRTVLDLGCSIGAMCFEAYRRGARKITGIDSVEDYIHSARMLARFNNFNINFMQMDMTNIEKTVNYINSYYDEPISIVFALSLYKHIGDVLFEILKKIKWKIAYLESNNAPQNLETPHVKKMVEAMRNVPQWQVVYLGTTQDRSPRCIWKIRKTK